MSITVDPTFPADSQSPRQGGADLRAINANILKLIGAAGNVAVTYTLPFLSAVDTTTGLAQVQGNPSAALGIATKQYVDNAVSPLSNIITLRKLNDQSVTNTTARVNDNDLVISAAANSVYMAQYWLWATETSGKQGGFSWSFALPAGATMISGFGVAYNASSVAAFAAVTTSGSYQAANPCMFGSGAGVLLPLFATFVTAGTAGSITLQWAQATAVSGDTLTIKANSILTAYKTTN